MASTKQSAKHRLATRTVTPINDFDSKKLAARGAATMTATGLAFTGIIGAQAAPVPQIDVATNKAADNLVDTLGQRSVGTIVSADVAWSSVEDVAVAAEVAAPEPEPEPEPTYGYGIDASAPAASIPVVDNSSVAAAALSLTGIPYVWGGETLAGLDCSGLVKMAFAAVGISLPHQSEGILASGVIVPYSEARPGDAVWYPGHVAVYIGDGQMVEATKPGVLSRVAPVRGGATFVRIG